MKTRTVLIIIGCFSALFVSMTLLNVSNHMNRDFTVVSFPEFNACYLYGDEYQVDIVANGLNYKGGANSGEVRLIQRELSQSRRWANSKMGEFEASYMKKKEYRIVEYKLTDEMILRDDFHYIKSGAINLILYRSECETFLEKFPNQVEILFNKAIQ